MSLDIKAMIDKVVSLEIAEAERKEKATSMEAEAAKLKKEGKRFGDAANYLAGYLDTLRDTLDQTPELEKFFARLRRGEASRTDIPW